MSSEAIYPGVATAHKMMKLDPIRVAVRSRLLQGSVTNTSTGEGPIPKVRYISNRL
jgi:hypothetical protein